MKKKFILSVLIIVLLLNAVFPTIKAFAKESNSSKIHTNFDLMKETIFKFKILLNIEMTVLQDPLSLDANI